MAGYSFTPKKASITPESIYKDVCEGNIKPIYALMGEESYYIDVLSDVIVKKVLKPEERDFNLITVFGSDTDVETVINSAKGFPMGAQRQIILVKEAQSLQYIEKLEYYLEQPQPSTVLILCYKNGTMDKYKKLVALIEKQGVLFNSAKLKDKELPTFIKGYLNKRGKTIEADAAALMAEFVGADLNRMVGELDKLMLVLPDGQNMISMQLVNKHVGVSKEFKIFELQDALAQKNVIRANQIAKYFDSNPKENPIQKVLPSLFKFFSDLMLAYYAPEKTEQGIADWLGYTVWKVRNGIMPAMKNYSGKKTMQIISEIRRTDARSKGVGNPSISDGDLMRELLYFILH